MFSKSKVNHKTIWYNSGMNDNQLNNKVVIQGYTQHLPLISILTNLLVLFHCIVIVSRWSLYNSS